MAKVTGFVSVGYGEDCPFCIKEKRKRVFRASPDNDFMGHCIANHTVNFAEALFGMGNVELLDDDPDDGSWKNR